MSPVMSPIEAAYDFDCATPVALRPVGAAPSAIREGQLQPGRVTQASTAISELARAHGLATPGDLMAVLGVETIPRLLAMLGFTGDLDGLSLEVATQVGDSPNNG